MNLATFDEKTSEMAEENMEQLISNVRSYKGASGVSCDASIGSFVEPNANSLDNITALNPPSLRSKGETNARIKSRNEKHRKKTTKVVTQPKAINSNNISTSFLLIWEIFLHLNFHFRISLLQVCFRMVSTCHGRTRTMEKRIISKGP